MKKEVRIWIESKGITPTMFRAALWKYSTEEKAKQQLVKAIKGGNGIPGLYALQYAIDRRKMGIRWAWVYVPLLPMQ
ncbi:MAG TPA: hypothetical protein VG605_18090 [Puia sp.]|nr:hypothetical protein [Puia sp.]